MYKILLATILLCGCGGDDNARVYEQNKQPSGRIQILETKTKVGHTIIIWKIDDVEYITSRDGGIIKHEPRVTKD